MDRTWSTERGKLICERIGSNVVLFRLSGHVEASFAEHIQQTVDNLVATGARPHLFIDAHEATGLDTRFRTHLTPWHKEIEPRLLSQNVLVKSKILSMAVTVINMAAGHVLRPYEKKQEFDAALAAARK